MVGVITMHGIQHEGESRDTLQRIVIETKSRCALSNLTAESLFIIAILYYTSMVRFDCLLIVQLCTYSTYRALH